MPRRVQKVALTASQKWGIAAGWAGLALLLIAGLLYYRQPLFNWTVKGPLIAAILMVAAWVSLAGPVVGEAMRGRRWLSDINGVAFVLAVIFIFALANFISNRRHHQWDLTKSGKFTLASLSQAVARKVDKPLTVTAFYSQRLHGAEMRRVEDLLKQYKAQNDKIEVRVVDPLVDRKAAVDKNIKTVPTLLFETADGKRQEVSAGQEKEITGALLKLTTKEKKKIYFLQGHGELDPDGFQPESGMSGIKQALTDQQHEVAKLHLVGQTKAVPADAAAVILAGPRFELQPGEVKALQEYLNSGGHVLLLVGPRSPELKALLGPWGLAVGKGSVVDLALAIQTAATPAVVNYEQHEITQDLRGALTAFPAARPVVIAKTPPTGVVTQPLMKTSENSWAEMTPGKVQYDGKDTKGPITLGAVATKDLGAPTPPPGSPTPPKTEKEGKIARLIVFGSADFATNYWTGAGTIANSYLVLNAINWLAEETALVNIPPRDEQPERVTLSDPQLRTLQIVNFFVLPAAALLAGLVVWWKRR